MLRLTASPLNKFFQTLQRIHKVKQQEEEERDYMTFEMRIRQERAEASAEGRAEGKAEGKSEMIISMLKEHFHIDAIERVSGWTAEKIRALAQANGLAVE